MLPRSRSHARQIVRSVLAADYGCPEEAFEDDRVTVSSSASRAGGRRYRRPERPLEIATMGAGVVAHCDAPRAEWVWASLMPLTRDAVFAVPTLAVLARYVEESAQQLRGPNLNFVCSGEDLRPAGSPYGVEVQLVEAANLSELYRLPGFTNALRPNAPAPDVLATVATYQGEVIGIAGASADSDPMWQIGIDVVSTARSTGVGRALVSRLSEEILRVGKLPHYATTVSNLASSGLAASLGYRLTWVELYVKDQQGPA